jgi:hypothetical protein
VLQRKNEVYIAYLTFTKISQRKKKRPRLKWLKDVEKDLLEMKVKRWGEKAVDREEWASRN